jgi:hypothetical protein
LSPRRKKKSQKSCLDADGMDQKKKKNWSYGILDMSCGLVNFRSLLPCTITYKTGQDQKSKISKTRCISASEASTAGPAFFASSDRGSDSWMYLLPGRESSLQKTCRKNLQELVTPTASTRFVPSRANIRSPFFKVQFRSSFLFVATYGHRLDTAPASVSYVRTCESMIC